MHGRPIGVSILTNGERLASLKDCFRSLIENCYYRPLVVAVFDNGSFDGTADWLENPPEVYGVEWRVEGSGMDLGCAAGSNRVAEMVRDCEYVLHLESDFEHLPQSLTGEDKMWLHRAVDFLDADSGRNYLYLRHMVDERAISLHWWQQWMPIIDRAASEPPYLSCPGFWWSNNPHLRRNEAIYGAGCLPLDESVDGPKGQEGWSKPELDAPPPGGTWIHQWGLFVHERWAHGDLSKRTGCGRWPMAGGTSCKYGFFKAGDDMFCQSCDREKGFEAMPQHAAVFRELW